MSQLSIKNAHDILKQRDAVQRYHDQILLQDNALIARIKKKNTLALPIKNMMELVGGLLELWWIVVSVAAISTGLTLVAAGVFNLVGIGYAIYTYQKQTKEQKLVESYQFGLLQVAAAKILNPNAAILNQPSEPFEVSKIGLLSVVFGMSSLVFFTYFYGLSSIMKSLGFVSVGLAMTGPIGISIAGVIGIGFGLYYGYRYYDDKKCKHDLKEGIKCARDEALAILSSWPKDPPQMDRLQRLDVEAKNQVEVKADLLPAHVLFARVSPLPSQQLQPIDNPGIGQG